VREIRFSKKATLHRINNDYTGDRATLKLISGKNTLYGNEIFNNKLNSLMRLKCTVNQKNMELSTIVCLTILVKKIHSDTNNSTDITVCYQVLRT
jgi:hypothetical protein